MAAKIRLVDGRELTVALDGKRAIEALDQLGEGPHEFVRFNTLTGTRVWVNPRHVSAVEDRPDVD